MALILKIPKPIEVETSSLGKLLLDHWSLSTMAKAETFNTLKNGDIREFMEEFVSTFARKYDETIEDLREAFESGEKIDNVKEIPTKDFETIATVYVSKELNNLIPHFSENDDDYETLAKENNELKVRYSGETNQEYLRRLVNASIKGIRIINNNFAKKIAGLAGKWQEPLIKNSKALNNLDMQINSIRSIGIPPIPFIENPINQSNAYLKNVTVLLEKLTLLTDAEIAQAKLLNDKTTSLLEAAAESGQQAKISVFIATFAILISAGMSLWSIIESKESSQSTTETLVTLREIEETYKAKLSSDMKDINKSIKKYNTASRQQFNFNKQANTDQTSSLKEMIKLLESIEKRNSNSADINKSNK